MTSLGPATAPDGGCAVTVEVQAIHQAGEQLAIRVEQVRLVSRRRTGVYRTVVTADPVTAGTGTRFPPGRSVQAARVVALQDSITPAAITHQVMHHLRELGAPVAGPLHPQSVATVAGHVGFWDWLHDTCVTPRAWGELTGAFHRAGSRLPSQAAANVGAYDPGRVFGSRVRRARELTGARGHPLHGAGALLRRFETALERALQQATQAAAQLEEVLILGDNQPGNIMANLTNRASVTNRASMTSRAGPVLNDAVLNDVERIAVGPAAVDLAALVLGVQHYGYPTGAVDDFRAGYGPAAPSVEQAQPFGRIRELSGAVVAMIGAGDSPAAEREMRVRAAVIDHPGGAEPWTYLGHPDATHLAGLPSTGPRHDCHAGALAPDDADQVRPDQDQD